MSKAPYKFLDYYTFEDRDIFFGREKETQQMVGEILSTRLLVLFSPSGSGKTSLINAGVRPQLEDMGYQTVYTRLETDPVPSVKNAVLHALKKEETENNEDLHTFLTQTTRQIQKPLVIFIDQFEEFFLILRDKTELRQEFIDQLAQIKYDDQLPVFLVLSLREDYFVDLHEFRDKIPSIFQNNANIRLEPFTDEEARRAIINPLKVVEHTIEPALVDTLINDLKNKHAGIEPITLQMVCCTLWNAKPENGQQLDLALYEKCGKAEKIIDNYIKERLEAIPWHEQRLMIKIFNALKTPDNTKQMRSYEDLQSILRIKQTNRLKKLLNKLSQNQILREEERQGTRWYEFRHDYLVEKICEWMNILKERHNRKKIYYASATPIILLFIGIIIYFFIEFHTFYAVFTKHKDNQFREIAIIRGTFFYRDTITTGFLDNVDVINYANRNKIDARQKISFWNENDWDGLAALIKRESVINNFSFLSSRISQIDTLVAALRDEQGYVRSHAAGALGEIGQADAAVIPALVAALRDEQWKVRSQAAEALVKLGQAEVAVISALVAALRDEQWNVRSQAAGVLGEIGQADAAVIASLVAALRDNDSDVRSQAAGALGKIGQADAAVIAALVAALRDNNSDVRSQAAWTLGEIGQVDASVIQALVAALCDNERDVYSQAAGALVKLGQMDEALILPLVAAFRDNEYYLRLRVVWVLGAIGQTYAVVISTLAAALRDNDKYIRLQAANALGKIGQADAVVIHALVGALRDKDSEVRSLAAKVLGKIGYSDATVLQALVVALQDKDREVRSQAAGALSEIGQADAAVLQALVAALRDENENIRSQAARALGEIGQADAAVLQALVAALRSEDENFRSQVAASLSQIGQADATVIKAMVAVLRDNDSKIHSWVLSQADTALFSNLEANNSDARSEAVWVLGEIGEVDTSVISALVVALQDKNATVRSQAAKALGAIGHANKAVIQALAVALQDETWSVCLQAARALDTIGQADSAVIQVLEVALRNNQRYVRSQAVGALCTIGQKDATVIQVLVAMLQDESEDIRSQALGALGKLLKNNSVLFLINEFHNPLSGYRTAAAHALAAQDFILQDSITLKKIDELRKQDKHPWVRLAAWKAYKLIKEKQVQAEKDAKTQKFIHQADSLFDAKIYFMASLYYEKAIKKYRDELEGWSKSEFIPIERRVDSLFLGESCIKKARCTAILNRPGQTIENLKTAFKYAPTYKDTLQAALKRGDKEWAIIKDNWYLNQVLLRKKSPPKK